jgi:ankyrin repeat protein
VAGLLLRAQADVEARDGDGASALHLSCSEGYEEVVRALLLSGAAVDAPDSQGVSALVLAAARGHAAVILALLDAKADPAFALPPQQGGEGLEESSHKRRLGAAQTALHGAATTGHAEAMRVLLDHGALVDAQDAAGASALHLAVGGRQWAAAQVLLHYGARTDLARSDGVTAAEMARASAHPTLTQSHTTDVADIIEASMDLVSADEPTSLLPRARGETTDIGKAASWRLAVMRWRSQPAARELAANAVRRASAEDSVASRSSALSLSQASRSMSIEPEMTTHALDLTPRRRHTLHAVERTSSQSSDGPELVQHASTSLPRRRRSFDPASTLRSAGSITDDNELSVADLHPGLQRSLSSLLPGQQPEADGPSRKRTVQFQ